LYDFEGVNHLSPAGGTLVPRKEEANRARCGEERLAVLPINQKDFAVTKHLVEFSESVDYLVVVFGPRDDDQTERRPPQLLAGGDVYPAQQVMREDPRVLVCFLVVASQCDPSSLFAVYLGHQTIIVGDDEQVTPVAIGVESEEVSKLIRVFLQGVPHKELYDGETSVYELAQIAFGGVIRLTEHFRCAPSIIAFSNALSYKGEIKPLREASSVPLQPHVVPFSVPDGSQTGDNVNQVEAEVIASLICAAIRQPEYAKNDVGEPASFGAVSLVGDKQALKIDTILRQRLLEVEYRRRQILCGDSAQFQGDERDVMFLSVVDSPPENPPLSMRQEGPKKIFKKRFNVAASRARNQMWVVHSLNHESDLQVGDYRRRLIEHSIDPNAWEREFQARLANVDQRSLVFEGAVLRILMERGYHVLPQYKVGAFSIDLVVVGGGRRLAIECDGERFHGPEQLQADLGRQAVLERLGWTFVRIRGSLFFRDEDRALATTFKRLEELRIPPELKTLGKEDAEARNELSKRVIRLAERLRAEWRSNGNGNNNPAAEEPRQPPREAMPAQHQSGTTQPTQRLNPDQQTLGRLEAAIVAALRARGRSETGALLMNLDRQLGLDEAGRRKLRASLNTLERLGTVRIGPNYVVLNNP